VGAIRERESGDTRARQEQAARPPIPADSPRRPPPLGDPSLQFIPPGRVPTSLQDTFQQNAPAGAYYDSPYAYSPAPPDGYYDLPYAYSPLAPDGYYDPPYAYSPLAPDGYYDAPYAYGPLSADAYGPRDTYVPPDAYVPSDMYTLPYATTDVYTLSGVDEPRGSTTTFIPAEAIPPSS